jgi:hypothetical protein
MGDDQLAIARYRRWYRKLLRFYSKPHRERFGESMEQTFHDLCRERAEAGEGLFSFVLWALVETSRGIVRENGKSIIMRNPTRFAVWALVVALLLLIPLAMQFTDEVQGNEAVAYGVLLLAFGGLYELARWLRTRGRTYRIAFGVGFTAAALLFWANGAVGIIGSEDNPANLMYGAVFAVGLLGAVISRLKPRGMAPTLFLAALVQVLIPVVAFFIWPAKASWGNAGVVGVFVINLVFAALFVLSAMLFRRAERRGWAAH